jgi:hypothetical protein
MATTERVEWRPQRVLARPPRQPMGRSTTPSHRVTDVAGGIHRHTPWAGEAGERQHDLGGRAGRQFHHPIVATVHDADVAGGTHRHTPRAGEAGGVRGGWSMN